MDQLEELEQLELNSDIEIEPSVNTAAKSAKDKNSLLMTAYQLSRPTAMDQYVDGQNYSRSSINIKDENTQRQEQNDSSILPQIPQSPKLIVIESVLKLDTEERNRKVVP